MGIYRSGLEVQAGLGTERIYTPKLRVHSEIHSIFRFLYSFAFMSITMRQYLKVPIFSRQHRSPYLVSRHSPSVDC
jgi:hypothetical protein